MNLLSTYGPYFRYQYLRLRDFTIANEIIFSKNCSIFYVSWNFHKWRSVHSIFSDIEFSSNRYRVFSLFRFFCDGWYFFVVITYKSLFLNFEHKKFKKIENHWNTRNTSSDDDPWRSNSTNVQKMIDKYKLQVIDTQFCRNQYEK